MTPTAMPSPTPKVSVITINYNNRAGLEQTMTSVLGQQGADFEYIVIDGGSTDGSVALLHDCRRTDVKWVSEPDAGIYNAMNKGLRLARGDYVLFLNSGDHFEAPGSLALAAKSLGTCDFHYFSLRLTTTVGESSVQNYPAALRVSYFFRDTLPHPATFIRRQVFQDFGCYDESLKICSDWKHFFVSICKNGCSYVGRPEVITVFYLDGVSSSASSAQLIADERAAVIAQNFASCVEDVAEIQQSRWRMAQMDQSNFVRALRKLKLLRRF